MNFCHFKYSTTTVIITSSAMSLPLSITPAINQQVSEAIDGTAQGVELGATRDRIIARFPHLDATDFAALESFFSTTVSYRLTPFEFKELRSLETWTVRLESISYARLRGARYDVTVQMLEEV